MLDFQLDAIDTVSAADAGVVVALMKVDGITPLLNAAGKPVTLTLHGMDSKAYRAANRTAARNKVDRAQKNKVPLGSDESMDATERDSLEMLAAVTSDWSGMLDSKGKDIPFTREGALELYSRFPEAREQAEKAVVNRALFTKASSEA